MSKADLFENASRERFPLGDERMERLLTDFFRREMPVHLQRGVPLRIEKCVRMDESAELQTSGRSVRTEVIPVRMQSATRSMTLRGSVVGLAVMATALLSVMLLIQSASTSRNAAMQILAASGVPGRDIPAGRSSSPAESTRPPSNVIVESEGPVVPPLTDGGRSPVETPLKRRTASVSVVDPQTGDPIEYEIPELLIKIFPIEKQLERKPDSPPSLNTPNLETPTVPAVNPR